MLVVPTRLLCAWLTRSDADTLLEAPVVEVREVAPMRPSVVVDGRVETPLVDVRVVAPVVPSRPDTVGRVLMPAVCDPARVVAPLRPLTMALLLLIEPAVLLPP